MYTISLFKVYYNYVNSTLPLLLSLFQGNLPNNHLSNQNYTHCIIKTSLKKAESGAQFNIPITINSFSHCLLVKHYVKTKYFTSYNRLQVTKYVTRCTQISCVCEPASNDYTAVTYNLPITMVFTDRNFISLVMSTKDNEVIKRLDLLSELF